MVRHLAPVERRNIAHRVDDVLIKTGEEPKAMLAGHEMVDRTCGARGELMSARVFVRVRHRDAAGLAARNVPAFEHNDLEAALDQLVRGAHAGDAAAEDDDASGHGRTLISRRSAVALLCIS